VLDIASRAGAVAAVNAGFFLPSGAPAGVLAAHGALVAIGSSPRAAIGIADTPAGERLLVGRIRAFWLPWTLWGGAWPAAVVRAADAGDLQRWDLARDVVGGAGLLVSAGAPVTDWTSERLRAGFTTQRHPRTMAGVDRDGFLWLFAADGRQPDRSIGMTFDDLVRLALAHGLRDALNLDGGGSTTMVVQGRVVNRPSDLTGPRAVSDALVVLPR
jgi:exopolysaccharide biosynthesis protein